MSPELEDVYAVSDGRKDVLRRFRRAATRYLALLRAEGTPHAISRGQYELVMIGVDEDRSTREPRSERTRKSPETRQGPTRTSG
jgi:hypothetical protein